MIWNKLNAKSVVPLHEYVHRDVYDTQQLSAIHNALHQAMMPHIKHTMIQFLFEFYLFIYLTSHTHKMH